MHLHVLRRKRSTPTSALLVGLVVFAAGCGTGGDVSVTDTATRSVTAVSSPPAATTGASHPGPHSQRGKKAHNDHSTWPIPKATIRTSEARFVAAVNGACDRARAATPVTPPLHGNIGRYAEGAIFRARSTAQGLVDARVPLSAAPRRDALLTAYVALISLYERTVQADRRHDRAALDVLTHIVRLAEEDLTLRARSFGVPGCSPGV